MYLQLQMRVQCALHRYKTLVVPPNSVPIDRAADSLNIDSHELGILFSVKPTVF
jgi:hypothetical protein